MRTFDSGKKFGLQPIGTSGIDESAPKNDSTRAAFPALATKGSVFAWRSDLPVLLQRVASASNTSDTINLRNNTANLGVSVDVPAWAAGCIIRWRSTLTALGVGVTYHDWSLGSALYGSGVNYAFRRYLTVNQQEYTVVVIPFYDEPIFYHSQTNSAGNTNGTVDSEIHLLGFIRNV